MKRTLSEAVNMAIRLMAVLFIVLFGASSCADYDFIDEMESSNNPEEPGFVGDTLIRMDEFNLHHGAWSYADGLLKADHYFDGYVKYMVDDEVVKTTLIDHENAPMRIEWEPIAETTDSIAIKKYLGCEAKDTILVESHQNQEIAFSQYKRECKLSFEGMEVTLTGSWYEASLGTAKKCCRYDSTTIATQVMDTVKVDGTKVEVEMDGKKYNRVVVTAKALNHFTDLPAGTTHKEQMDIEYSVLVPFGTEPEPTPEPEPEDEFLGFDKKIVPGDNKNDSKIIITEHWSVSGDKEIVFTQSGNYSFTVSGQQRVFGETLSFVSGLTKSTNSGNFNEVKENQFVRTITDTYTAKFNLCDVKATASYNEAYVEYRGERINFEFAEATVSYKGLNNPTATEVTVNDKLFSRRSYEVTFAHNLLGTKNASVLVDKEINLDPSTPDEWGEIDIEKTKNFGRICVTWKEVAGQTKLQHFYSGTIITTKGIISFSNGYKKFTAMDTNIITKEVGNGWDGANLNPAYITVSTNPNVSWQYYDVVSNELVADIHSSKMQTEGGIDFNKPFVANGGEANVYNITENGNSVKVVVTFNGEELFSEVFAK